MLGAKGAPSGAMRRASTHPSSPVPKFGAAKQTVPEAPGIPPAMLCTIVDGVAIGVHTEAPPSDAEWAAWFDMCHGAETLRGALVVTDGGGPNASQRARIMTEGRHVASLPRAVVTRSVAARCIVTAIGWFGKDIRAFAPTGLQEAMSYLGIDTEARHRVVYELASLRVLLIVGDELWRHVEGAIAQSATALVESLATDPPERVRTRIEALWGFE